jgi:hypothetical protein
MKIVIETLPLKKLRYKSLGDYFEDHGVEYIQVAELGDWRMELAIAIHELVEDYICKHRGIKEEDIMAFDLEFEKNRPKGNDSEPGDSPLAPYTKEHQIATAVERLLCSYLDVSWEDYEQRCIDVLNSI